MNDQKEGEKKNTCFVGGLACLFICSEHATLENKWIEWKARPPGLYSPALPAMMIGSIHHRAPPTSSELRTLASACVRKYSGG